jgi:hypothetical protein
MTDKSQYISPIIDENELSEADLLNVAGGVGSSPAPRKLPTVTATPVTIPGSRPICGSPPPRPHFPI